MAERPLAPPPLADDCFALPPGVEWTPVSAALDYLRRALRPVVPVETVRLEAAGGRVAAAPVLALRANPPAGNSAVDGYGFAGPAPEGVCRMPLVPGRAAAGAPWAGVVPPGHAIRVLTGAVLPRGVDTVVLEEDVATDGSAIAFHGPVRRGANTRAAGEDVAEGELIVEAGRRLTPGDLAILAATGHDRVDVFARLRVAVLSTGDEIVPPGAAARRGQIHDANRPMLLDLLDRLGHMPVDLGHVSDDREALRALLDRASGEADAIVTTGGASAGDEDHVSALLGQTGSRALWRIAIKPGRPLVLGMWQGRPVFGLPGNPVAAFVTAFVIAGPALGLMAGAGWRAPPRLVLPAGFEKRKRPGRMEYLRARVRGGQVEVFPSEGSGRISGLAWAEGLVELPHEGLEVRRGDPVTYIPFPFVQG